MTSRSTFCGLLLLLAVAAGCKEKTPCDPDQELRDNGYCYPVTDAAAAAPGPGEAGASVDPFGRSCTSDDDCAAPAALCAIQNGPPGFCSSIGCEKDPSICPAGWSCMDLAALGIPAHLCVPPM